MLPTSMHVCEYFCSSGPTIPIENVFFKCIHQSLSSYDFRAEPVQILSCQYLELWSSTQEYRQFGSFNCERQNFAHRLNGRHFPTRNCGHSCTQESRMAESNGTQRKNVFHISQAGVTASINHLSTNRCSVAFRSSNETDVDSTNQHSS